MLKLNKVPPQNIEYKILHNMSEKDIYIIMEDLCQGKEKNIV